MEMGPTGRSDAIQRFPAMENTILLPSGDQEGIIEGAGPFRERRSPAPKNPRSRMRVHFFRVAADAPCPDFLIRLNEYTDQGHGPLLVATQRKRAPMDDIERRYSRDARSHPHSRSSSAASTATARR
jgi:hypothetical protein